MISKFTGKISYIILTFFIAAIIISFALTGFEGFGSAGDTVAKVDGEPITFREYNNVLNQELQRYSQMFGTDLTNQQIQQFRIKENALNSLIQQQIMINLAKKIGLEASQEAVKDRIRELPVFLTNERFDVNKYRGILNANQLTPSIFESMMKEEIAVEKLQGLLGGITVSDNSAKAQVRIKNAGAKVHAARFDKESMTQHLEVSQSEIDAFLNDEKNKDLAQSLYEGMSEEFNQPEQLQASHILIPVQEGEDDQAAKSEIEAIRKKATPRNFAELAKKESKGPSASNGGDLGWFARGSMVPEFEQAAFKLKPGQISEPVKTNFGWHIIHVRGKKAAINKSFDEVKDIVAKRHLQKTKRQELKEFNEKLTADLTAALENNQISKLRQLAEKYGVTLQTDADLSFYESAVGDIVFDQETIASIVAAGDKGSQVLVENNPIDVKIVKSVSIASEGELNQLAEENFQDQKRALSNQLSQELRFQVLSAQQEDASIVTYPNLL